MIIFILTRFDIKNSRDGTGKKVMALFVEVYVFFDVGQGHEHSMNIASS